MVPSEQPSGQPSEQPTMNPSTQPSTQPTEMPTEVNLDDEKLPRYFLVHLFLFRDSFPFYYGTVLYRMYVIPFMHIVVLLGYYSLAIFVNYFRLLKSILANHFCLLFFNH